MKVFTKKRVPKWNIKGVSLLLFNYYWILVCHNDTRRQPLLFTRTNLVLHYNSTTHLSI